MLRKRTGNFVEEINSMLAAEEGMRDGQPDCPACGGDGYLATVTGPIACHCVTRQEKNSQIIEAIVAIADTPDAHHNVIPRDELLKRVDNHRYFWDDKRNALVWKGPASELRE